MKKLMTLIAVTAVMIMTGCSGKTYENKNTYERQNQAAEKSLNGLDAEYK